MRVLRALLASSAVASLAAGAFAAYAMFGKQEEPAASSVCGDGLGATTANLGQFECCTITGCNCVFDDEFSGSAKSDSGIDTDLWYIDNELGSVWLYAYVPECATGANVSVSGGLLTEKVSYNPRAACPTQWDSGLLLTGQWGDNRPPEGGSPTLYDIGEIYQKPKWAQPCGTIEWSIKQGPSPALVGLAAWQIGAVCASPLGLWAGQAYGANGLNACNFPTPPAGSVDWPENEQYVWSGPGTVMATGDYWNSNYGSQYQSIHNEVSAHFATDPSTSFHTYSVVRTCPCANRITFYLDGVAQTAVNGSGDTFFANEGGYQDIPYWPTIASIGYWVLLGGPDAGLLPLYQQADWIRETVP